MGEKGDPPKDPKKIIRMTESERTTGAVHYSDDGKKTPAKPPPPPPPPPPKDKK